MSPRSAAHATASVCARITRGQARGLSHRRFHALSLSAARPAVDKILVQLTERQKNRRPSPREVSERIDFLLAVGLGYLSLDRSAATLSRRRSPAHPLATQIGSRLRGVLYVLDEPSIGLHARDTLAFSAAGTASQPRQHRSRRRARRRHHRRADFVVDLGPGAGNAGATSLRKASRRKSKPRPNPSQVNISAAPQKSPSRKTPQPNAKPFNPGASANNLKDVDITLPLGLLTVVTGRLGFRQIHARQRHSLSRARAKLYRSSEAPARTAKLSAPSTSTKSSRSIRHLSAARRARIPPPTPASSLQSAISCHLPESRERGYRPGRFSFNVKGGRCKPARATAFAASK